MGDKGGKKDKEKASKQTAVKKDSKAKKPVAKAKV